MATRSRQPLEVNRLVAMVLFLIVAGLFARMFFFNYVSAPAQRVDFLLGRVEQGLDLMGGFGPHMTARSPDLPQPMRDYLNTGDEQAKQRWIQYVRSTWRDEHSLAIWGSLAGACISIIIVVIVGLPMLQQRRA